MKVLSSRLALLASVALCLAVSACKQYRPFTRSIQDEYGLTRDKLKKIQFYTSSPIVLDRTLTEGESRIEGGTIVTRNGVLIEQVIIRSGTPGVAVFIPEDNRLGISFDEKNDKSYLMFGPSQRANGQYTLLAKEWLGRTRGVVTYAGNEYRFDAQDGIPVLLVDLRKNTQIERNATRVKGRRVD